MAAKTYRFMLRTAHPFVQAGGVYRCAFNDGARTRRAVVGSEWTLAEGDVLTVDDSTVQRIMANETDDNGAPFFQEDAAATPTRDLDAEVYDNLRTR